MHPPSFPSTSHARLNADGTRRCRHTAEPHSAALAHNRSGPRSVPRFAWPHGGRRSDVSPTVRHTPGTEARAQSRGAGPPHAYRTPGSDTRRSASPHHLPERALAAPAEVGTALPRFLCRCRRPPPPRGSPVCNCIDTAPVARPGTELGRSRARTSASARRGATSCLNSIKAAAAHAASSAGLSLRAGTVAGRRDDGATGTKAAGSCSNITLSAPCGHASTHFRQLSHPCSPITAFPATRATKPAGQASTHAPHPRHVSRSTWIFAAMAPSPSWVTASGYQCRRSTWSMMRPST
jgi:hypothetical protein